MKPAVIFSIPMTTAPGYCWRWRSADSNTDSKKSFVYYHDCLADAKANGHSVQPVQAQGPNAPGGNLYALR